MVRLSSTIGKIYVSNFLVGLVFWYSIEKVFMRSVGIDAAGIGIILAAMVVVTLLGDIPAGLLADRWSRRGLLIVAIAMLAVCSVIMGSSHGFWGYLIGELCYGVYLVGTSGTYQALVYDELHEEGRAQDYSRVMGAAYGTFLVGAGLANIAGGLLAQVLWLRWNYLLTVVPCVFNILLLARVHEPQFHRALERGRMLHELRGSMRAIAGSALLRSVVLVWSALTVAEVFKQDFSQLYMLKFTPSTVVIGLLWAAYAFSWAVGSFLAHRMGARLNLLVLAATGLMAALGLTRSVWGLVLFMVQAVAAAAVFNLFETRVQHATPSAVRASVLSVISTINRVVSLPAALVLGWLIQRYDVFVTIQWVSGLAALAMLYWLIVGNRRLREDGSDKPENSYVEQPETTLFPNT